MATDTVLQWKTHITDSTDQDTILGNLSLLEQLALSINGGDDYTIGEVKESLSTQFANLRTKIKDGTLKPTEWKDSTELKKITTALTNASSGKIATLTKQGEDLKKDLGKKLDSKDFSAFKAGDSSWKSALDKKLPSFASAAELEKVKTLLNKEVSHWTAEATPLPQSYTATAQVKAIKQPWGENEAPEPHTDDLCTVIGEKATDKGVSYRFIKHPTNDSYKWTKVIDNDGALALGNLKTFEEKYNQRQEVINYILANKQPKGNYVEKTDYDKNNTEVAREIKELKGTYKVTVTTQGEIRNGQIIGGTTHDSKPAILHTAHVYGILGNKITDPKIINKLTWTVNKGRTTDPKERTVTGATCYVTAKDFVRVFHTQESTPQFYDIELNSNF